MTYLFLRVSVSITFYRYSNDDFLHNIHERHGAWDVHSWYFRFARRSVNGNGMEWTRKKKKYNKNMKKRTTWLLLLHIIVICRNYRWESLAHAVNCSLPRGCFFTLQKYNNNKRFALVSASSLALHRSRYEVNEVN